MNLQPYQIIPKTDNHTNDVETLLDIAFGLDRRTKSSYRLREGEHPIKGLSFVAVTQDGTIIGTISFWDLYLGEKASKAILLGPLAVHPKWQSMNIGQELMRQGLEQATNAGHKLVLLVGDAPYYAKLGFKQVPKNQLIMPGPNNPDRLLYLQLQARSFENVSGLISSPLRIRALG